MMALCFEVAKVSWGAAAMTGVGAVLSVTHNFQRDTTVQAKEWSVKAFELHLIN